MAAKKVYVLTYFYANGTRNREYFTVKAAAEKQLRKYYRNHKGGHGDIAAEGDTGQTRFPNGRGTVKVIRNTEGFRDGSGRFHPIRSGDDYEPDEVGEDRAYSTRKRKPVKKAKKRAAKKNPAKKSFPVGKFVKVHSVRVNSNGTIDVLRTK